MRIMKNKKLTMLGVTLLFALKLLTGAPEVARAEEVLTEEGTSAAVFHTEEPAEVIAENAPVATVMPGYYGMNLGGQNVGPHIGFDFAENSTGVRLQSPALVGDVSNPPQAAHWISVNGDDKVIKLFNLQIPMSVNTQLFSAGGGEVWVKPSLFRGRIELLYDLFGPVLGEAANRILPIHVSAFYNLNAPKAERDASGKLTWYTGLPIVSDDSAAMVLAKTLWPNTFGVNMGLMSGDRNIRHVEVGHDFTRIKNWIETNATGPMKLTRHILPNNTTIYYDKEGNKAYVGSWGITW